MLYLKTICFVMLFGPIISNVYRRLIKIYSKFPFQSNDADCMLNGKICVFSNGFCVIMLWIACDCLFIESSTSFAKNCFINKFFESEGLFNRSYIMTIYHINKKYFSIFYFCENISTNSTDYFYWNHKSDEW